MSLGHDHVHDHEPQGPFEGPASSERSSVEASLDLIAGLGRARRAQPSPDLRARLLRSVDALERYSSFAPRLAAMLDVPRNDARFALHALASPERWPLEPLPGMRVTPLPLGAGRAGSAILACFAPTAQVPRHRHLGSERVLVFKGAFETDDGRRVGEGQELRSATGSVHSIVRILGGEECLCAIVCDAGVELVGSCSTGGAL